MDPSNTYPYQGRQSRSSAPSNPHAPLDPSTGTPYATPIVPSQGHPYQQPQGQHLAGHAGPPGGFVVSPSHQVLRPLPFSNAESYGGYHPHTNPSQHSPTPASHLGYSGTDPRYQYPPHQQGAPPQGNHPHQFIPTPSQTAQLYAGYDEPSRRSSRTSTHSSNPSPHHSLYAAPAQQHPSYTPAAQQNPATTSTSSPTSSAGERHPCPSCDKTFSRPHDMRRHYETHHVSAPPVHTCQYCGKGFGRADSLKRHIDNGCDEMPQAGQS